VGGFSINSPHTGTMEYDEFTTKIPSACITMEDTDMLQRMQDRGQKIVIEMSMEAHQEPDVPSRNLVISLNGSDKSDEFILIGGHIDSWDIAEGAMDDGAGAFCSWEALRIIASLGLRPRRTIRAVMFVNEENGDRGGEAFARDHAAEAPKTSIAIETDAGTFTPFRLGFTGSNAALGMLTNMGAQLLSRIGAGNVTAGGGGTDISGMCALGVPCSALEVLDPRVGPFPNNPCLGFSTATPQPYAGEIPDGYFWYHHTAADTIDKLDPTQLQLSAAAMGVWTYAIAQLDTLLPR